MELWMQYFQKLASFVVCRHIMQSIFWQMFEFTFDRYFGIWGEH